MPGGGGGGVTDGNFEIGTVVPVAGVGGGTNCGGYGLEPGGAWGTDDTWGTKNGVCCVCLPTAAACDGAVVLYIDCWDVVGGGGIGKFEYCTTVVVPGLFWNWG